MSAYVSYETSKRKVGVHEFDTFYLACCFYIENFFTMHILGVDGECNGEYFADDELEECKAYVERCDLQRQYLQALQSDNLDIKNEVLKRIAAWSQLMWRYDNPDCEEKL